MHNAVSGFTVNKIIRDTQCDLETAAAWAIFAKYSLMNNIMAFHEIN